MNDEQRKAMEQAAEALSDARQRLGIYSSVDALRGTESYEAAIAALRAQLDAPAEKVEPFAWAYKRIVEGRGIRFIEKRAEMPPNGWVEYEEIPLYLAPPTAAQIAAAARAEAIEECAKVCIEKISQDSFTDWPRSHAYKDGVLECVRSIRALKSSAPTEGEKG